MEHPNMSIFGSLLHDMRVSSKLLSSSCCYRLACIYLKDSSVSADSKVFRQCDEFLTSTVYQDSRLTFQHKSHQRSHLSCISYLFSAGKSYDSRKHCTAIWLELKVKDKTCNICRPPAHCGTPLTWERIVTSTRSVPSPTACVFGVSHKHKVEQALSIR